MTDQRLLAAVAASNVGDVVHRAEYQSIAREVASDSEPELQAVEPAKLLRTAFVNEVLGVNEYIRELGQPGAASASGCFASAFTCWRSFVSFTDDNIRAREELMSAEWPQNYWTHEVSVALHLAACSLPAKRTPEARLELRRFELPDAVDPRSTWRQNVATAVAIAFVRLVRKADGWRDIELALRAIASLRALQQQHEEAFLANSGSETAQVESATELVALYHLAQIVTTVGEYLRSGAPSITQLNIRLERHRDRAIDAVRAGSAGALLHVIQMLWVGCRLLAHNSIWTHVSGLGELAHRFAETLTDAGRSAPIIELWPSQQEAFERNLFDPYRRAVLVQMPTSAGKTLIAKFAIVQAKALNPTGTVAYVVPTRALVNQITLDLRIDLRPMGLSIEQTVPAFEMDPSEARLLSQAPDVLVTTPEKLDLLLRRDHESVRQLALVIGDEAHNLREAGRGARLELLLGTVKRERAQCRFLLLSPFIPNDTELVQWLGEDRALPPIAVSWRPARRVVGALELGGAGRRRMVSLHTLRAADNSDIPPDTTIPLGSGQGVPRTIQAITGAATAALMARGSVLVLCRGQGTAAKRALQIAEQLRDAAYTAEREAVIRFLEAEVGDGNDLIACLRKGVAYHHAGLSPESRWLVEGLIRKNQVQVVCGTTTLAQGVNFPISSVVIETLKKGDRSLEYQDFWNIAGRAGRTLVDTVGVVGFPAPNAAKRGEYETFLRGEAEEITSQLVQLIDRADEIAGEFNLNAVYNHPELSALMQFLAHAMRVANADDIADEVEDLLRASLIFHQARRLRPDGVQRLVRLCRSYLEQIRGRRDIVTLADSTGFSTPTVLRLLVDKNQDRGLRLVEEWKPQTLFGEDLDPLTRRIEAISHAPEIRLGQGARAPFSPALVAAILRDWVSGRSLAQMAAEYWVAEDQTPETRLADFSKYLFSDLLGKASWGLGALQGICLAGNQAIDDDPTLGYVPSMVFFGVNHPEAVWLRMAGLPRLFADGLGALWRTQRRGAPESYEGLRRWLSELAPEQWAQSVPPSRLTGNDMQTLWREFFA